MNELIYGKDDTQAITSIEIDNDKAYIFIEGQKDPIVKNNKFWILANEPLNKRFLSLEGNLHYKYGIEFSNRAEFSKMRWLWRNEDIWSIYDPVEALMVRSGYTSFKGLKHTDISVLSFDIESSGLKHNAESRVIMISNTFRNKDGLIRKLFSYDEYENDGQMLEAWCSWVREVDPSVMLGHNIFGFDLPYIQHCANMLGVELSLGKNGDAVSFDKKESKFRKDATQFLHYFKARVFGRQVVDTMFLAIKHDLSRAYESYALKKIIAHEGLEVKNRVFYDADKIRHNYKNIDELIKIKAYAIHDADDALALYDLMIPPIFYWSQSVPKSFQSICQTATGSQINSMMVRSYLQDYHSIPKADESRKFSGSISFGEPGIFRNNFKVDVSSLFPSIMLQYEIYNKQKDPNANMLKILKIFTEERLKNKKLAKETGEKYYDDLQASRKTCINSLYGFMGAQGLNFNYFDGAEQVTTTGRNILQTAIVWATGKKLEVNFDT